LSKHEAKNLIATTTVVSFIYVVFIISTSTALL